MLMPCGIARFILARLYKTCQVQSTIKLKIFSNGCRTIGVSQKYKTVGVSFPRNDLPLLDAAKAKAKARRWSFSNYVCSLIQADLESAAKSSGPHELNDASLSTVELKKAESIAELRYKIRSRRKPEP